MGMRAVITAIDIIFGLILVVSAMKSSKSAKLIALFMVILLAFNIILMWM